MIYNKLKFVPSDYSYLRVKQVYNSVLLLPWAAATFPLAYWSSLEASQSYNIITLPSFFLSPTCNLHQLHYKANNCIPTHYSSWITYCITSSYSRFLFIIYSYSPVLLDTLSSSVLCYSCRGLCCALPGYRHPRIDNLISFSVSVWRRRDAKIVVSNAAIMDGLLSLPLNLLLSLDVTKSRWKFNWID